MLAQNRTAVIKISCLATLGKYCNQYLHFKAKFLTFNTLKISLLIFTSAKSIACSSSAPALSLSLEKQGRSTLVRPRPRFPLPQLILSQVDHNHIFSHSFLCSTREKCILAE